MCAAPPDDHILGQGLLVGREVAHSISSIGSYGGLYRYLRPLTPAEASATLTEYLIRERLLSPTEAEKLMAHPMVQMQIALAGGLPHLLAFLSEALDDPEILRPLMAAHTKKDSR